MANEPEEANVAAWVALNRAQRRTLAHVEQRLKDAGLPPIAWYDALWELEKAGANGLRPYALESALLLEQYNLSRLVDRLVKAGLVERGTCREDRRGQVLRIGDAGRDLRRRMWETYAPAIEDAVGARLSGAEARTLAAILGKL